MNAKYADKRVRGLNAAVRAVRAADEVIDCADVCDVKKVISSKVFFSLAEKSRAEARAILNRGSVRDNGERE